LISRVAEQDLEIMKILEFQQINKKKSWNVREILGKIPIRIKMTGKKTRSATKK